MLSKGNDFTRFLMLKQKRITSVQRIPYDLFGIVYDNLINKLELIVGSFETYVKVTMFAM